ncbi:MAG: hypothetical protein WBA74_08645 [Cyclobacteriaceae bacterium]
MKRVKIIFTLLIVMAFVACNDENLNDSAIDAQIAAADISSEQSAEATYEEVDDMVEQSMLTIPSFGKVDRDRDASITCAEISHDEAGKTIELLFDGTCEGPEGNIKSGKIIITYNERRYVPGAFRKVTFDDFYVNDIKIEGARTITNVSETSEDSPTFTIEMENGKVIFSDGTFISRNANHTRTWIRAENPLDDLVTITGQASGIKRDGTSYTSEITSAITFKRACRASGTARFPVSGVKEITAGENVLSIDFGDGSCDNEASFTLNGNTIEKEIQPRGLRRR